MEETHIFYNWIKRSRIVSLIFSFCLLSVPAYAQFAEGDGSKNNPYQVATLEQLQAIGESDFLDKHFIQTEDIDASVTINWEGGKGFRPIGSSSSVFSGSYDGQGFVISNLVINRTEDDHIGLFGVTSESVIKHVHLNDIDIHGRDWVGGLVGSGHSVLIEYSKVSGQIIGNNYVGSLAGGGYNQVNYSYSQANVNGHNYVGGLIGSYGIITESFSTGNVTGNEIVGGLVGANLYIHSSYATGNVAGNSRVGGLVGENEATPTGDYAVIVQSYATGKVTGDDLAGSLVGNRIANMLSNYWSSQSSGRDNWIGSNYNNKLLYLEKVSPSNGEEEWIGSESNRERLPVSITTSRTNLDRFYQTAKYGSADDPSIQLFGPPIVDVEDLAINQMQGQNAWIYMHKLDFVDTWQLTDGYPRLRWESPVDTVQAPDAAIIWVDR
ncbi:GLUG motif-containing protein [Balneolaceae bacterium ANBcel3]|nr:GLUG motif-containing protein [Balneolaceae bacterium ANBcel3]